MKYLAPTLERNRAWAGERVAADPGYFSRLAHIQRPDLLWIGCSDSRVPANQIVGLDPGRAVRPPQRRQPGAHTDLNCLSVMQFAERVWGSSTSSSAATTAAAASRRRSRRPARRLIDNWLGRSRDLARSREELAAAVGGDRAPTASASSTSIAQVSNVCRTTDGPEAWREGRAVAVHGWIYGIGDGLIRDLEVTAGDAAPGA